jgi:hypothetical protein
VFQFLSALAAQLNEKLWGVMTAVPARIADGCKHCDAGFKRRLDSGR